MFSRSKAKKTARVEVSEQAQGYRPKLSGQPRMLRPLLIHSCTIPVFDRPQRMSHALALDQLQNDSMQTQHVTAGCDHSM